MFLCWNDRFEKHEESAEKKKFQTGGMHAGSAPVIEKYEGEEKRRRSGKRPPKEGEGV